MKIIKGDTIKIIAGKDRGKTGKVIKVLPEDGKILIEGLNLYKKRVKPKKTGEKGQTVLVPRPLEASNALAVCKSCIRGVRVGYRLSGDKKERYCKKCGAGV